MFEAILSLTSASLVSIPSRVPRRRTRRAIAALVAASLGPLACAPRAAPRLVVAAPAAAPQAGSGSAAAPSSRGGPPRDYAATLTAIAERFERDLSLPRVEVALRLFASRQQFEQALLESGYARGLARQAASSFHAIGGARTILVNESQLSQYPWDQRVRLLAHELAHSVQYRLAGGVRGTSEQWLREGFADYVSSKVTAGLGYGAFERQREAVLAPIGQVLVGSKAVPLGQLRTFAQWVNAQPRHEIPLYAQAYVASEMLIESRGLAAMLHYFELSLPATRPDANFAEAFGLTLSQFESSFGQRWLRVVVERGQRETP
jgi:hypothetical protein